MGTRVLCIQLRKCCACNKYIEQCKYDCTQGDTSLTQGSTIF